jgi:hypothetical protein
VRPVRCHAAGVGEGPDAAPTAAVSRQEPDRGGNGRAARSHVPQCKTGEMGMPIGGPRATITSGAVKMV